MKTLPARVWKQLSGCMLFILASGCSAALAQNATCPTTLTVSPTYPLVGSPVTVTLTLVSPTAPGSTNSTEMYATIGVDDSTTGQYMSTQGEAITASTTPASVGYSFIPTSAGNYQANGSFFYVYSYGYTPLCVSGTAPLLNFQVYGPGGAPTPDAALVGPYTFFLRGTSQPNRILPPLTTFAVGSFVADGAGHVVGEEDVDAGARAFTKINVSGSYSVDQNGVGSLTLQGGGLVQHFDLALSGTPTLKGGMISEIDAPYLSATGQMRQQNSGSLASGTNPIESPAYTLSLSGTEMCPQCLAVAQGSGIEISGLLTASSANSFSVSADSVTGSTIHRGLNLTGTVGSADQFGRFTLQTMAVSGLPDTFVAYYVDNAHFFLVSSGSLSQSDVVGGVAEAAND